jgi:hypothetical protein
VDNKKIVRHRDILTILEEDTNENLVSYPVIGGRGGRGPLHVHTEVALHGHTLDGSCVHPTSPQALVSTNTKKKSLLIVMFYVCTLSRATAVLSAKVIARLRREADSCR